MWTYFDNREDLDGYIRYRTVNFQKEQIRKFHKETVTCTLMGKQTEAYHLRLVNYNGSKWQTIFTGAMINGSYVAVELYLPKNKKLKNQKISAAIKQILDIEK